MKKHRINSGKPRRIAKKTLPLNMLAGFESLERREVLAANVLASSVAAFSGQSATQQITMVVETPGSTNEATLSITLSPTDGSSLDPAAATLVDSSGTAVTTLSQIDNVDGGIAGTTIVTVPAGEYQINIGSENATSGSYSIDVSLIGDVDNSVQDSSVSEFEFLRAQAAATQHLGTGNFVTEHFFNVFGIDLAVDQADIGMDGNGDGVIDNNDLAIIQANRDVAVVNVELQTDSDAPAASNFQLTNDTGVSNSDNISSSAAASFDLTDESLITSVTASINGGTAVDLSQFVSDLNAGTISLSASEMATIAGGTVNDGVNTISISATDSLGNSGSTDFTFTIISNNSAPTSSGIGAANATEDTGFLREVSGSFSDADAGDVLTFSLSNNPSWLSIDSDGTLSGTPANADVGTTTVTITATDSQGATVSDTLDITVINTNDAPVASNIPDQTTPENSLFSLDLANFFSDQDVSDSLTFTTGTLPSWLSLSGSVLSGTPTDTDTGTFNISATATDTGGLSDNASFSVTVSGVNDSPVLTSAIPDRTINEDNLLTIGLANFFSDPENDTLTFSVTGLPSWLTLNSATGVISGTPGDADIGTFTLTATASDPFNASASDVFDVTSININDVPVADDASFNVRPTVSNGEVVGAVNIVDGDIGDTLTVTITSGNANGAFAIDNSGVITVADATQLVDGNVENLTITATDAANASDTASVTINVVSNFAPTANDDSGFVATETTILTINGSALTGNDTDPDGDSLVVSATATSTLGATVTVSGNVVSYNAATSPTLSGLNNGQQLTDTFVYTVSDGNGGTDTATVTVSVTGVDTTADVAYRLAVVDSTGTEVTSLDQGDTFELVAFVQDIRDTPTGVFSGFIDVTYDQALATPTGEFTHSTTYSSGPSGDTDTPGLLDEVGGSDGITPLGGDEFELWRISFTADAEGTLAFSSDPTEDQLQHPTLLFGGSANVANEDINFGSTIITIGAGVNASSDATFGGFTTNSNNPLDVNGDASVSPLDALLVINAINTGTPGNGTHEDVNADGLATPLDALIIINELVQVQSGASTNSDVLVGNDSDVSGSDLADGLDILFAELDSDLTQDLTVEELQSSLSPALVDAINEVLDADEEQQDQLWADLADELGALLGS